MDGAGLAHPSKVVSPSSVVSPPRTRMPARLGMAWLVLLWAKRAGPGHGYNGFCDPGWAGRVDKGGGHESSALGQRPNIGGMIAHLLGADAYLISDDWR